MSTRSLKLITLLIAAGLLSLAAACASEDASPLSNVEASGAKEAAAPAVTPAMLEAGHATYQQYCVACHGEGGKGDGPAAGVLKPPPRDHTDRTYMDTLSDKQIADVITMGGAIKGKPLMPSHPQIRGDELTSLVAYVRSLSR